MLRNLLPHSSVGILQDAIQAELQVSNRYKHFANQLQRLGYFGGAKFFKQESAEELEHYQKIADYLNDRGGVAEMPALAAVVDPIADLGTALDLAYNQEVDLGVQYESWYESLLEFDVTTAQFLLQFLEIQRKSIGEYGDWLSRYNLAGGDKAAMLILDKELGG